MRIYVDADSQPAKDVIIEAGKKFGVRTVLVMSTSHYTENFPEAETVLVENVSQAVDIKMMNLVKRYDIAVTSDTNLGLILAAKGAVVITGRGRTLNESQLAQKAEELHLEKRAARSKKGRAHLSGPAEYTEEDGRRLRGAIEAAILKIEP